MATSPKSIFEVCIHRPIMTSMMSLLIIIFGAIAFSELPVRSLPNVDPTVITVVTSYPGASVEVVEIEVTEPIEDAVNSADSIKLLTSESIEEGSVVRIEFHQSRDIDLAAQDVRDRISSIRSNLPDTINEPTVRKQEGGTEAFMWLSLQGTAYSLTELSRIADDVVKDRLQTIPGVSSIIVAGEKRFAIRIRLDTERMAARRITVADVEQALKEQNVELPSGRVENRQREMTIQVRGQMKKVEEFNRLILRQEGSNTVRLLDVGYAEAGVEDERVVMRNNGTETVSLGVVRQSGANTIEIASGVDDRLEELKSVLPADIHMSIDYDVSMHIEKAVNEVFQTLGIAGLLVILTIFLFLRNIRSTIIPALSIPISIFATFAVLYWLGYSINLLTLLALVLAIGIVVDDAIVVLENMHRHIEKGMNPFDAAVRTMKEIAFPIVTITLSLIAVFTPLMFITGTVGRLLVEFAAALIIAVVVSAFVALTLSPTVGARVLRATSAESHGRLFNFFEHFFGRLNRFYELTLSWVLAHRKTIIVFTLLTLWASWFLFMHLDSDFLPEEDQGQFLAVVLSPVGATPEYTDRMVGEMEKILAETPEVINYWSASTISLDGRAGDPAFGMAYSMLKQGERRHMRDVFAGPDGLAARFFNEIEGAMAFPIMPRAIGGGFSQSFQVVITHSDLVELDRYSRDLISRLWGEGYLTNIRSVVELTKPELRVSIDRDRAGALGVSIEEISRTLQVLFGGDDLSEIKLDGKEYEVIVQLDRSRRLTPTDLERVFVRSSSGELLQLNNVVSFETGAGPNQILRFQRLRSTIIEATPVGVTLGTAIDRTVEILNETLPPNFSFDWEGEARELQEASRSFYFFSILAIVIVYMVLAAQFESLIHPFTVMLALPMAFVGAFGSLYFLGWVDMLAMTRFPDILPRIPSMNLNIFSQIGLVILIGLVTKNSILLVEFANQRMAEGMSSKKAMFQAGLIRFRPILMTSMATIVGILPIAIGFGDAAESRRPLGVVAVGGLFTSTLLTLYVIPVFYTIFDDLSKRFKGKAGQEEEGKPPVSS